MLYKKAILIFLSVFILFTVTGCWDSLDVNKRTLVVTVIADKKGDDYCFYVETPNIGQGQQNLQSGAESGRQKYYTIYANGNSFADARRHLNAKADNPLFLGTVKALVITDDLAKSGIEEYMFRMQSDIYYRKALNVITSFSDPNEILSLTPLNNVSIGEAIDDSISSLKMQGKIKIYTVSDILEFIYSKSCFVLINMDVEDGVLTYNGFSVFHQNKLIDFIPQEDAKGLVWIISDYAKRVYVIPMEDYRAAVEVDLKSKSFEPNYENAKLTFNLKYKLNFNIMYLTKNIKFNEEHQKYLQKNLQEKIAGEIADAIVHSKKLHCDYLQFKDYFRIKYPNELKNINWLDTYLNTEFKISVESSIQFGSMMDFAASGD